MPAGQTHSTHYEQTVAFLHCPTTWSLIFSHMYVCLSCRNRVKAVDTHGKGPLLNLEGPASVWPPPRSGRDGGSSAELEAPLLNPSKYPADLDSVSDDCFLDDINTQVGRCAGLACMKGVFFVFCCEI